MRRPLLWLLAWTNAVFAAGIWTANHPGWLKHRVAAHARGRQWQ